MESGEKSRTDSAIWNAIPLKESTPYGPVKGAADVAEEEEAEREEEEEEGDEEEDEDEEADASAGAEEEGSFSRMGEGIGSSPATELPERTLLLPRVAAAVPAARASG